MYGDKIFVHLRTRKQNSQSHFSEELCEVFVPKKL